jgi:parallel beta-helix repeat protein
MVTDINIANNIINGGGGAAFDFAGVIELSASLSIHGGKVYLQNVRVTGNEISDCASNGIYVYSSVGDPDTHPEGIAEVKSLTIQNNDITGNAACGIKMEGVIQSSLLGNTIKSNGKGGIQLNFVTACNIISNVVNRNLDGIRLDASSGNTIQNNTTSRNARYGISLADLSNNNLVRGNQALNNTTFDLVQDAGCTGNVWKNNNFMTKSGF